MVWSPHKDKVMNAMFFFFFFIQHSSGLASSRFWVRLEFRFMRNATKIASWQNEWDKHADYFWLTLPACGHLEVKHTFIIYTFTSPDSVNSYKDYENSQ